MYQRFQPFLPVSSKAWRYFNKNMNLRQHIAHKVRQKGGAPRERHYKTKRAEHRPTLQSPRSFASFARFFVPVFSAARNFVLRARCEYPPLKPDLLRILNIKLKTLQVRKSNGKMALSLMINNQWEFRMRRKVSTSNEKKLDKQGNCLIIKTKA